MGILECASGASVWRGYDYYKENKVLNIEKIEKDVYAAAVSGSADKPYSVELHVDHPRRSKCNCPHAEGRRIICKHIVAAYFKVFPEEAEKFYTEAMAYQAEEEQYEEELFNKVCEYVSKMKKSELEQTLLDLLMDGPGWQYDRFVRENALDD